MLKPLFGLGVFALVGAVRSGWFAEGDTFWQIQAGTEIRQQHTVFLTDTFSWSMAGRAWHPNSWLFDVLLSMAWTGAGSVGLALFTFCCVALVGVSVTFTARALGARTHVTTALLVVPLLLWLSARPQTLTYALLPVVVLLAGRLMEESGRRLALGLAALYLLLTLWVNLHLAALAAVPALAAGLAAALLTRRRSSGTPAATRRTPAAACGCMTAVAILGVVVLGCATSPFGFGALGSALATRDASTELIPEWAPLWRTSWMAVFTWAGAAIAVALAMAAWRRPHVPMFAASAGLLLLGGAEAARFSPMALVVAMPAAAAWASGVDWRGGPRTRRVAFFATGTAVGLVVALVVLIAVRLPSFGRPAPDTYPTDTTVQAIPDGCRVLNEYDDGGYLVLRRSADGVRVAMDGRNDVYGAALITRMLELTEGRPGALAELNRDSVRCLLLDPRRPLVAQARKAGWLTTATDSNRVLLLSPGSQSN
ncbi:hypothetical protein [Cryptosporangium sp. NPDC048952]|uniref:hypothetical protein n=1 Tax=Cryptosporangium sp. NPDC048952 TaxID=3363961 RepID=UPI0037225089